MILNKKDSINFKYIKNASRIKLIKITKNIAVSITLISILASCKLNSEPNSVAEYIDDNNYYNSEVVKKVEINEDILNSDEFKKIYNGGYLMIKKNNSENYDIYNIDNLILVRHDAKNYIIDLKNNKKDIITNRSIDINSKNIMSTLKNSTILYQIYIKNIDDYVQSDNNGYIKINEDDLTEVLDNWDNRTINYMNENNSSTYRK